MFSISRASALAVASLVVAATAAFADPSMAWEADTTPTVAYYIDHASAPLVEAAPVTDTAEAGRYDPSLTEAVTAHVVAPVPAGAEIDTGTLAGLVARHASTDVVDAEHECLAGAVYFEAKGEPLLGQLAVADVILNRAQSGRYPASVCGVVTQKSQFSFVRGGRIPPVARSSAAWRDAVAIAHIARADLAAGGIGEAMFFHARYVSPRWRGLTRVASIGNHIFYR